MYNFTYHRPTTVRQAANLLAKNEEAKLLAGAKVLEDILGVRGTTPIEPRAPK